MENDLAKAATAGGYQGKKEKLAQDIQGVVSNAGDMVKDVGSRVERGVEGARAALAQAPSQVSGMARQAADITDEYVRENPWKSIGLVAAAGVILGMLMSRR
jgi:ElaB/YqjD/DUF883 family membrane-anchored ribosome-binding protein